MEFIPRVDLSDGTERLIMEVRKESCGSIMLLLHSTDAVKCLLWDFVLKSREMSKEPGPTDPGSRDRLLW